MHADSLKYFYLTLIIMFFKYSRLSGTTCTQLYGFEEIIIIIPARRLDLNKKKRESAKL